MPCLRFGQQFSGHKNGNRQDTSFLDESILIALETYWSVSCGLFWRWSPYPVQYTTYALDVLFRKLCRSTGTIGPEPSHKQPSVRYRSLGRRPRTWDHQLQVFCRYKGLGPWVGKRNATTTGLHSKPMYICSPVFLFTTRWTLGTSNAALATYWKKTRGTPSNELDKLIWAVFSNKKSWDDWKNVAMDAGQWMMEMDEFVEFCTK